MEITAIALQTVEAGQDVAFTETAVNGTNCIVHRQGSGIIKLRESQTSAGQDILWDIRAIYRYRQAVQWMPYHLLFL